MEVQKFPILMYHRVEDSAYMHQAGLRLSGEHCSLERFHKHIEYLSRNFYVVPLPDIVDRMYAKEPLPRNVAAITFDDGTRDHIEVVLPILQKFGLRATFFVMASPLEGEIPPTFKMQFITGGALSDEDVEKRLLGVLERSAPEFAEKYRGGIQVPPERYIGEPTEFVKRVKYLVNYMMPANLKDTAVNELFADIFVNESDICKKMFMGSRDIRTLTSAGMTIGCHSYRHYTLSNLLPDWERVDEEVRESKMLIKFLTGITTQLFCYPAGGRQGYTAEIVALVKRYYDAAFTTGTQQDLCSISDPLYELPRLHEKYFSN